MKERYKLEETSIVGSWMYDLCPNKNEVAIRNELKTLFSTKLPLIAESDFEFLKCERNSITSAPPLAKNSDWSTTRLKVMIGQSKKLYCRLKCINSRSLMLSADEIEDNSDYNNEDSALSMQNRSPRDYEIPESHQQEIGNVASSSSESNIVFNQNCNNLLNEVLDQQQSPSTKFSTLEESLNYLEQKLSNDSYARLSIDREYFFDDALGYYKSKFIPEKRIKVRYLNEPAVDTGGVTRQFIQIFLIVWKMEVMVYHHC